MRTLLLLSTLSACGPVVSTSPKDTQDTGAPDETGGPVETAETAETAEDSADPGWPALVVNELMADNDATVADATGAYQDWVELYNPTGETVDLDGWTVSDDLSDPARATLGDLAIAPGEFLLLWADGSPDLGADHLDFALEVNGEAFGLFAPDGTPVDGLRFGQQATDVSLARSPDGGARWTLASPATPGASNGG